MIEPLRTSFEVDRPADHVFHVWTTNFAQWWPRTHTVTGDKEAEIVLEPRLGGRIYERTAAGAVHEWGEITCWEPPQRLGYRWYLRRDRADATDVEVTFHDLNGRTRVDIEHRGWERLGTAGPDWREANTAGWRGLLPHFVEALRRSTG